MAAQQGGGAGGGNGDDSMDMLWLIGALFILGWVAWHFGHTYFKQFFLFVRQTEMHVLLFFLPDDSALLAVNQQLEQLGPGDIGSANALLLSTIIGEYWRWPLGVLLALGLISMLGRSRFKRVHTMQTLLDQESHNWPQVGLVKKLDLVSMPIDEGPWAMAMTPLQFCKKYKLMKVEKIPDGQAIWRGQSRYKITVEKDKALRLFSMQLGAIFTHPLRMPPYAQALFAIFAARAAHDTVLADKMLRHLAISASKGKIDYRFPQKYVMKYFKEKAIEQAMQRHAYIVTLLATLLELARTDGVLATADFLWLKPIDRRLWYVCNCVGRQVVYAEVAGIFAHWKVERELQRPLSVPVVDMAVKALEDALAQIIYEPENDDEENAIE